MKSFLITWLIVLLINHYFVTPAFLDIAYLMLNIGIATALLSLLIWIFGRIAYWTMTGK